LHPLAHHGLVSFLEARYGKKRICERPIWHLPNRALDFFAQVLKEAPHGLRLLTPQLRLAHDIQERLERRPQFNSAAVILPLCVLQAFVWDVSPGTSNKKGRWIASTAIVTTQHLSSFK
jgi:hypothetical protein